MNTRRVSLLAAASLGAAALSLGGVAPAAGQDGATYGFEECDQGWKASSAQGWRRQSPGDNSGFAMGYQPYTGNTNETVTSPVHKWGGGKVTLSYSYRYQFEPPETSLEADNLQVEWSTNGKTWKIAKKYATVASPAFPAFAHDEVTFKAPKGKLFVQFRVSSDTYVEGLGAAVDEVSLPAALPAAAKC